MNKFYPSFVHCWFNHQLISFSIFQQVLISFCILFHLLLKIKFSSFIYINPKLSISTYTNSWTLLDLNTINFLAVIALNWHTPTKCSWVLNALQFLLHIHLKQTYICIWYMCKYNIYVCIHICVWVHCFQLLGWLYFLFILHACMQHHHLACNTLNASSNSSSNQLALWYRLSPYAECYTP